MLNNGISINLNSIVNLYNFWLAKFPNFESWQHGYGTFTYSIKEKDIIIEYIKNQKEHHKTENFYGEFKRMIIKNRIEFDERYFL